MRGIYALAAAAVALCVRASDVAVLGKGNFSEWVGAQELALVEFYAPWCGHCQALAPHYEAAATALKGEGVALAKVDCTVEDALCGENGVGGFPTLKVMRHGSASPYGGPRKTEGIIEYMQRQKLPAVLNVSATTIDDFKSKGRFVLLALAKEDDKESRDAIAKYGNEQRDSVIVGVSDDVLLASEVGVTMPGLVAFRKFDEPQVGYSASASLTYDAIDAFVAVESIPLIDEITPDNFAKYVQTGLPLGYYFVNPESSSRELEIRQLADTARAHRGKLNIVWIDGVKFANHAKALNLKGESWPAFAIQNMQTGFKYPLELGKNPTKEVADYVQRFVEGKVPASVKSAPIPASQPESVIEVVADEFDKYVFQDDKDVLVEFYAPWCGHCKRLAPTYSLLADMYARDSSASSKVQVVKMDATANDVPPSAGIQLEGFPTIVLKPAGKDSRTLVDYSGDRSLESLVDFIATSGTHKARVTVESESVTHDEL
ncbi:protein disulfide-isomerase [Malassezia cuniculi]|uniref:protein disulfide-isomerase n=1 Tax=Malassezia cuniculi TaxID=948313 RepID=A0AAF0J7D8_9BASI|nr:protein disulfide-isomerase [Malassezia cuniculi]